MGLVCPAAVPSHAAAAPLSLIQVTSRLRLVDLVKLASERRRWWLCDRGGACWWAVCLVVLRRSEEHTSELQSPLIITYAVFCLKKIFFFFNDTATTEIYTALNTLSLHDALPIS